METHLPEISARQITQHRPAIEAELIFAGERQVKDHTFLYGFSGGLF